MTLVVTSSDCLSEKMFLSLFVSTENFVYQWQLWVLKDY